MIAPLPPENADELEAAAHQQEHAQTLRPNLLAGQQYSELLQASKGKVRSVRCPLLGPSGMAQAAEHASCAQTAERQVAD